jgi:hypothetical protein
MRISGTGLSCVAKKQHATPAIIGAAAPDGHAVKIQNAQHSRMVTTAASAERKAMPWSRCSTAGVRCGV